MSGEKDRLRRRFLKMRREMSVQEREALSAELLRQLIRSDLLAGAGRLLTYMPLPDEADISGIRAFCHESGRRIACPRVSGDTMAFYELTPEDVLLPGVFGVREPDISEKKQPVDWEDALCLTPGAVFDGCGIRYGYGRGYYDRYFHAHPGLIKVGVAFFSQISRHPLFAEETDIPVDYLLTERGIARCNKSGRR